MFVEHSHQVTQLFTSLQVVFNLHEVLDEFNVGLVEELDQFDFEVSVVEHSDCALLFQCLLLLYLKLSEHLDSLSLET